MQFAILSLTLFAAVATAGQHIGAHAQHFHHRRALNTTSAEELATSSTAAISLSTGVTDDTPAIPTSDSVLTYTLGTGSSTTVITTTIKHTATEYLTRYVTTSADPTTTTTSTSTSTRYITVMPAASASGSAADTGDNQKAEVGAGAASVYSDPTGSSEGACGPVTVTVALSTVTVTYTPVAVSPTSVAAVSETVVNVADPSSSTTHVASSGFLTSGRARATGTISWNGGHGTGAPHGSGMPVPTGYFGRR